MAQVNKSKKNSQNLKRGRRPISSGDHKYSRGVVAIVAGSKRFPGAALLTVGGARRGGAGYVKYLDNNTTATHLVLGAFPDVAPIKNLSGQKIDSLVVGPGASTLRSLPHLIPVVLDSGALSLAQSSPAHRTARQIIVVTPHEGELRALGYSMPENSVTNEKELKERRISTAQKIADDLNVICVLKGNRTVIAAPHLPATINTNGGPELATAGSGDVLAGLIGAYLASWKPTDHHEAQRVVSDAVHLHSAAGAHAARSKKSVVATDILESLAYC